MVPKLSPPSRRRPRAAKLCLAAMRLRTLLAAIIVFEDSAQSFLTLDGMVHTGLGASTPTTRATLCSERLG
jgi:hypothetical protein